MSESVCLGSTVIDSVDPTPDGEQLLKIEQAKRAEVLRLCLRLQRLLWSRFEATGRRVGTSVRIEYWLVELEQGSQIEAFWPPQEPGPDDPKSFGEEAGQVLLALEDVRRQLALAISPAVARDSLLAEDGHDRRALRQAATKMRGKTVKLPSRDGEKFVSIPQVARNLPYGRKLRVTAYVESMTQGSANLKNVRIAPGEFAPSDDLRMPLELPLRRYSVAQFALHGPMLLHAMDHGLQVTLDVKVFFFWVDGSPTELDLVDVVSS